MFLVSLLIGITCGGLSIFRGPPLRILAVSTLLPPLVLIK